MQNDQHMIQTANFTNPFTGKVNVVVRDGYDDWKIEAELDCAKVFIKEKLSEALKNEELALDEFVKSKIQFLIVQLYQPTSFIFLYEKLEKFREYLYDVVPEFNEVYNHYNSIRGHYFNEVKSLARPVSCVDCSSVYAVPENATIEQLVFFQCPYCKSTKWIEAPAGTKYFKNQR